MTVRLTKTVERMLRGRQFAAPLLIFLLLAAGSYTLYATLQEKELDYARKLVRDELNKTDFLLNLRKSGALLALKRMALRWKMAGGTPLPLWRSDVRNYAQQFTSLKTVEWVDSTYHIRWAEPSRGNEKVIGLSVLFDAQRAQALKGAAGKETPTLTPPLSLVQGYTAFIAYVPLTVHGNFDGFLAGVFSIEDFFGGISIKNISTKYAFSVSYDGKEYFSNGVLSTPKGELYASEKNFWIYDKLWTLRLAPTPQFIENQESALPIAVLIAGLLVAALSALSASYMLISRLKSEYLLKANQLNSAILASTAYLIVATDEEGKVVTFNKAAEDALGYDAHEVIGKTTPALWHDDTEVLSRAESLSTELKETIEPGFDVFIRKPLQEGIETREWTFIRKDRSRFTVNLAVTPLRDKDGKATGYLGVIEDITERKQTEEALRISEEIFRTAMAHASIGQALVSPEGRWLKVNSALCRLLGYSEEELLANDFQSITHPDDLEQDQAALQQLLAGETNTYQLEKRYYHKSGQSIWALLSVSLVRRAGRMPDYLVAQIQDITERKEMERMKNEFISIVSHELRTPLTSIRGSLGLILGALSQDLPGNVKGLIAIAHDNCERLILLINDILDIDKITSGHMRFDMKEESLAAVTLQAVQANEAYAHKFNVTIAPEPIDKRIKVQLDAARYIQALSNLLSNAAKFSPPGEKIVVAVNLRANRVRISVKDNGIGIPEEFHARIFGKFSQADASATRAKGGTGLGLHITKQIVEHMQGSINFDTQTGKGTTFWIEFPIVSRSESVVPADKSTAEATVFHCQELQTQHPNVLHVEDDADLSHVLTATLQNSAAVVTATTLKQAEELLRRHHFAMIILDIKMPDGSGLDLLERLDSITEEPPPVVILAADMPPPQVCDQVTAVIVKTCTSEEKVVETILNILEQRQKKTGCRNKPLENFD